jgi:glycosyltransferase involved in cell wall biosynthesis
VLLEAAACGIPFVASRVGGIPEIAHLGRSELVPPGDPYQLARVLEPFLTSRPFSSDQGPSAVRTQDEAVKELVALFQETLRGYGAARPFALPAVATGGPVSRPETTVTR